MIDIKFIRKNQEAIQKGAEAKNSKISIKNIVVLFMSIMIGFLIISILLQRWILSGDAELTIKGIGYKLGYLQCPKSYDEFPPLDNFDKNYIEYLLLKRNCQGKTKFKY